MKSMKAEIKIVASCSCKYIVHSSVPLLAVD